MVQGNLINLLLRLDSYKVDYVLVGGLAAAVYGSPMNTSDVDVACNMCASNQIRLFEAVEDIRPLHRMAKPPRPFTHFEAQAGTFKYLYLHTDLGTLDCLGEVKGLGNYDAVARDSVIIPVDKGNIKIITLNALIRAKVAMGRPQDRQNVEFLTAIKNQQENAG